MLKTLIIRNFKGIKEAKLDFAHKNIIAGNNGVGKSTILEAISLVLGQSYGFEITPYIFHNSTWSNLKKNNLPKIIIEAYFDDIEGYADYTGTNNSLREESLGIKLEISFDDDYLDLVENNPSQIPCEYYTLTRKWFSEDTVKPFRNPFSVQIINSSSALHNIKMTNFITRHLQSNLSDENNRHIKTVLRGLRENFNSDAQIKDINAELSTIAKDFHESLEISVDMTTASSWNAISCPFVDEIPVHNAGQGKQCILKTLVSIARDKQQRKSHSERLNIYLIEEPECHLSHTYMHHFLSLLNEKISGQIFLTTHNSFIANRLNLKNLLIIHNTNGIVKPALFRGNMDDEMFQYFYKTTDYPTLRLALCDKAILVEGPTDEMAVQYYLLSQSKDLFADKIELIAVGGLRFKNFVTLARAIGKRIAIITDNDGKTTKEVTELYLSSESSDNAVRVFTPKDPEEHTIEVAFVNHNTDRLNDFSLIVRKKGQSDAEKDSLTKFLISNKTMWMFRLLESGDYSFKTPQYIIDAISWIYGE